jgi:acyl carrier protein
MNGSEGAAAAGLQFSDWSGILLPGGVALAMGLVAVVALAFAVHRKSWALGGVSVFAVLVLIVCSVFVMRGGGRLMQKYRAENERGWLASSEDGRLQFRVPGNWKDDAEVGEDAAVHLANRIREQYLLAYAFPRGGDVALRDWATAVNEEMSSNVENSTPGPLEERNVGEYPALRTRLEGTVEGVNIVYHVTFLQLPEEFAYVLCWTLKGRERTAFPIFDKVVDSFTYTPVAKTPAIPYDASAPVAERVRVLVANQLGVPLEKVTPDAEVRALGADDLDAVELVMVLEEEFGGEISEETAEKLVKVADLIQWAESQKAAPVSAPEEEAQTLPAPAEEAAVAP